MILKVKEFQEACKNVLDAVDTSSNVTISETLELINSNGKLYMNVTNKEYYVTVTLNTESNEELHAVIQASLFLNLVSKITTDEIELKIVGNALNVKANGTYNFPLIYDGDKLIDLQKINIDNVTNSLVVDNVILQKILKYNTKELQKSGIKKLVQRMFYIDDKGAITFTSGACVNSFTLDSPIKILLTEKIVKLFKLFTDDKIQLVLGHDLLGTTLQTKLKLSSSNVELTTIITSDQSLIDSVPVNVIRNLANNSFNYKVIFDRIALLDSLSRLSLFLKNDVITLYTHLIFNGDELTVFDTKKENNEKIKLLQSNLEGTYNCILNTNDLKLTLESITEQYVTLVFGNNKAVVFERPDIKNILPECAILN